MQLHLEKGLVQLHGTDVHLKNGFVNHGPMVIEALAALGCDDEIPHWLEKTRHTRTARKPNIIDLPLKMESALGKADYRDALARRIQTELSHDTWPKVLERWVSMLAPGVTGAALHGLIRVGHAARSMGRHRSAIAEREFAEALAYWASVCNKRPALERGEKPALSLEASWALLRPIPAAMQPTFGSISQALKKVDAAPDFKEILGATDFQGKDYEIETVLSEVFLLHFLQAATNPYRALVYTHMLTSFAAALHIGKAMPGTPRLTAQKLLQEVYIAAASLKVVFSGEQAGVKFEMPAPPAWDELIESALRSGDDHIIKLTEACYFLEHRFAAPAYRRAAFLGQHAMGNAYTNLFSSQQQRITDEAYGRRG